MNACLVTGDYNKVIGNFNDIYGDNNHAVGNYNTFYGSDNTAVGNYNEEQVGASNFLNCWSFFRMYSCRS